MEVVTSVASNIAQLLVNVIGKQFGYLIFYNSNIKDLREEADKLRDKGVGLKQAVDAARRNREVIAPDVDSWLNKVDDVNSDLEKFFEEDIKANRRCLNGWCSNPKSRYSLSRTAKKKLDEVVKLKDEGTFERISTPAPPPKLGSMFAEVKGFESRIMIMSGIMESLMDDKINMIGICGMGGVGKTTMVKEIIKIGVKEKLFDEVAMTVFSQIPDVKRIQGEIADQLGLKFETESDRGRAEQLHDRLKSSERVLVVLDDVWTEPDFEEIGIPSRDNHKGCKIIVTTRSKDVLTSMKSQKDFTISVLSEGEAWDLFLEKAGDSVNHPALLPIAQEVANECGGLPIAIVTVGKALGGKKKEVWLDALDQLRKSTVSSFSQMDKFVFSRIRLSYNCLENEEYKSCFLLCCLFPEDFNISVESLVRYSVGLNWLKGIDSLYQARNRVYAIIDKLKNSFLLLDSDEEGCVELHDVVRDAAISIVSEGEQVFLVRCDELLERWPDEDKCKQCTAISLAYEGIDEYPDAPLCPKLQLLHFVSRENGEANIPHNLFNGMEELRALTLDCMAFSSQISSVSALKHLRMLTLNFCTVRDTSVIGALENLEILSLVKSVVFDFEIGQLRRLKLLDFSQVELVKEIAPGVMSSFSRLEELYMREFRYGQHNFKWPSVKDELKSLSHLKILDIHIPDSSFLPENFFFDNLVRFTVTVGLGLEVREVSYEGPNTLKISATKNDIMDSGIFQLLKKTEILSLTVDDVKNGLYELSRDGFPCLKKLTLNTSPDLEYLVDAADCALDTGFHLLESMIFHYLPDLREIWHGQLPCGEEQLAGISCFGNLTFLHIDACNKLKNVIPASVSKYLVKLKALEIFYCHMVKEVVAQGVKEEKMDKLQFPKLKSLDLYRLQNLVFFCSGARTVEFPSLTEVGIVDCPKLKTFVSGNVVTPNLEGVHIGSSWYPLKGDLNNTINEIFKDKHQAAADPNSSEEDQLY